MNKITITFTADLDINVPFTENALRKSASKASADVIRQVCEKLSTEKIMELVRKETPNLEIKNESAKWMDWWNG